MITLVVLGPPFLMMCAAGTLYFLILLYGMKLISAIFLNFSSVYDPPACNSRLHWPIVVISFILVFLLSGLSFSGNAGSGVVVKNFPTEENISYGLALLFFFIVSYYSALEYIKKPE